MPPSGDAPWQDRELTGGEAALREVTPLLGAGLEWQPKSREQKTDMGKVPSSDSLSRCPRLGLCRLELADGN